MPDGWLVARLGDQIVTSDEDQQGALGDALKSGLAWGGNGCGNWSKPPTGGEVNQRLVKSTVNPPALKVQGLDESNPEALSEEKTVMVRL